MRESRPRLLVLTGTQLRHRYLVQLLLSDFPGSRAIVEPKTGTFGTGSTVAAEHRRTLAALEARTIPDARGVGERSIATVGNLNDGAVEPRSLAEQFDFICLFGTRILSARWLTAFPARVINLHLGWAPEYRGSGTLFWPFVNNELHFVGTTFHLAVDDVDAGPILRRIPAPFIVGDDYFSVVNRVTRMSIESFSELVLSYESGAIQPQTQPPGIGRTYRRSDWTEEALRQGLSRIEGGISASQVRTIEEYRHCHFSL